MQKTHWLFLPHWLRQLDRLLQRVTSAAAMLAIPLALLLCAQWPLRDWFHAFSREANDLAQLLFGLYVSIGITYATRSQLHLTPNVLAQHYSPQIRAWFLRLVSVCIVIPWAAFILSAATPMVWQSILQLEKFPDTFNPGYFILKMGVWLLALLVILQAVIDIFRPIHPVSPQKEH
ncbi:MAG: TRAP transporter small permease subunit [Burkholderiaceae bacterium]